MKAVAVRTSPVFNLMKTKIEAYIKAQSGTAQTQSLKIVA